jgi:hypothetical protein
MKHLLLFLVVLVASAKAQQPEKLAAPWKFTFTPSEGGAAITNYFILQQTGPKLTVRNLLTKEVSTGTVDGNELRILLPFKFDSHNKSVVLRLEGSWQEGYFKDNSKSNKGKWIAKLETELIACDHTPVTHYAANDEERHAFEQKFHCTGWHPVK